MQTEDVKLLRDMLLRRRREIFDRMQRLEAEWQALSERDTELEEEAQKADLTSIFGQLDDLEKNEIEEIDLALCKLALGTYGSCEHCGNPISAKRLEIVPASRLCRKCAMHFEETRIKLPRAGEVIGKGEVPDEYKALNDDEVVSAILEHLREAGLHDLQELHIFCEKGVIYLEGLIPSEREHQALRHILTAVMGFTTIVDRLSIDEVAWEREDRTPGRDSRPREVVERVPRPKLQTDDVFEQQEEGIPYSIPDLPLEEE